MKKRIKRYRECKTCGMGEWVSKYSPAPSCRACSAKSTGLILKTITRTIVRVRVECGNCRKTLLVYPSRAREVEIVYCSKKCWDTRSAITRTCKECFHPFPTSMGRLGPTTNSTANFCSRPCYNQWLCRTDRRTGRGSGWKRISKDVLRQSPFCAICGTMRARLQVHHIIPYRLTFDNDPSNLIPLCLKHHRWIETMFVEMERLVSGDLAEAKMMLGTILRARQSQTRLVLAEIMREIRLNTATQITLETECSSRQFQLKP